MPTIPPRGALLAALLLVVPTTVLTMAAGPASADDEYSQLEPPPLCSAPHTGACVAQPHPDRNVDQPILVDMPTMTRDSTSTGLGNPTGYVTFTVTRPAGHAGYVARPPSWIYSQSGFAMIPIPGYSETGADQIYLTPDGRCDGRWTCTYKTTDTSMQPGWYRALNINGDFVGQDLCPPDSPNFVYGCFWTSSQSAFYVPKVGDVAPPVVRTELEASGHTVNAIAAARDPEGQAMSLTWDWGDGTVTAGSLGTVATHTYSDVADFTVTARVSTTDGRHAAWSQPAGIVPPAPVLQSVSRVGATSNGVATGLLQEWPAGTKTLVYGWTNGCPSDPANSLYAADAFFASGVWEGAQSDGTFSRSLNNLQPAPAGYAVLAQSYVEVDGQTYLVRSVSDCTTTVGAVATTTGATVVGEDEVPVDSSSVPVGHVAVVDAGTTDAEQRLVTAHGSLILETGLSKAHPAGAKVVDAGTPVPPYADPPPPASPAAPTLPAGDGSTVTSSPPPTTTKLVPGAPAVSKTTAKPGQKMKVKLKPGADGGSAITGYEVSCSAKGGGKTRTATAGKPKLTVTKLTKGKKYKCKGRATNAVGTGPWSKAGKKVLIPAREARVVSTT